MFDFGIYTVIMGWFLNTILVIMSAILLLLIRNQWKHSKKIAKEQKEAVTLEAEKRKAKLLKLNQELDDILKDKE